MQYDLILVQQITVGIIPCAPVLFLRDEDFQRGMSGRVGVGVGGREAQFNPKQAGTVLLS